MRTRYRTLNAPKALAERIGALFPALSHMQAQSWAAQYSGYRNWQELRDDLDPRASELPPGADTSPQSDHLKARQCYREEVLRALLGARMPDEELLFWHVDPDSRARRYRKLGASGAGSPAYRTLAYDLFSTSGEAAFANGARYLEVPTAEQVAERETLAYWFEDPKAAAIYRGLPPGAEEAVFLEGLARLIVSSPACPWARYEIEALQALREGPFEISELGIEEPQDQEPAGEDIPLAVQSRALRFFHVDEAQALGFAALTTVACVSQLGNDLELTLRIDEAFTTVRSEVALEAWLWSLARALLEPLSRLIWCRVGVPTHKVTVFIETDTDSEFAWDLVQGLPEVLETLLEDQSPDEAFDPVSIRARIQGVSLGVLEDESPLAATSIEPRHGEPSAKILPFARLRAVPSKTSSE